MPHSRAIPSFFLYGEPVSAVRPRFLHVEPLDKRSRPNDWKILPHAHAALSQLFAITGGSGIMLADDRRIPFTAPCLLLIPARAVHAFSYESGTTGSVLTIGQTYLTDLVSRAPSLACVFAGPAVAAQGSARDARQLALVLRQLAVENAWQAAGHEAALDALLTMALVIGLRVTGRGAPQPTTAPANLVEERLVARFRQLVETRFRERPKLAALLGALRVSEGQLRRACAAVSRQTPLQIIHERTMLEAKRMLLYSNTSAEEIAYRLGFQDPAYFSRFFREMAGINARAFRTQGSVETP